jgi:hypothetical protein
MQVQCIIEWQILCIYILCEQFIIDDCYVRMQHLCGLAVGSDSTCGVAHCRSIFMGGQYMWEASGDVSRGSLSRLRRLRSPSGLRQTIGHMGDDNPVLDCLWNRQRNVGMYWD